MYKHETKECPRCRSSFECKSGSVAQCRCSTLHLSAEESFYVGSEYEDCLCINCLAFLQREYAGIKAVDIYKHS